MNKVTLGHTQAATIETTTTKAPNTMKTKPAAGHRRENFEREPKEESEDSQLLEAREAFSVAGVVGSKEEVVVVVVVITEALIEEAVAVAVAALALFFPLRF